MFARKYSLSKSLFTKASIETTRHEASPVRGQGLSKISFTNLEARERKNFSPNMKGAQFPYVAGPAMNWNFEMAALEKEEQAFGPSNLVNDEHDQHISQIKQSLMNFKLEAIPTSQADPQQQPDSEVHEDSESDFEMQSTVHKAKSTSRKVASKSKTISKQHKVPSDTKI